MTRALRLWTSVALLSFAVAADALSPASAAQSGPAAATTAAMSYTEEQAARGQMLFRRHCLFCHSTNKLNQRVPASEPLRGALVGTSHTVMNLGGRHIFNAFPTVYHLYARIREGMPAWDIDAASPAQKVDIVAYILKENGVPAGTRELPLDPAAMRKMLLKPHAEPPLEPGFEWIFNGKDFTNLRFFFGANCTPSPGCGKTDPGAFSVRDGVIVGNGRHHGYMYTEKRYLDFDLRLDLRVEPPPDHDLADEEFLNGGGMGLFVTQHGVWGTMIEVEGAYERLLHPYGIGAPIEAVWHKDAVARANKGPGPWNAVQIVSKNGRVDLFLNGTKAAEITKHTFKEPGHIAIQYQGGTWMWRRLRIKAE